MSQRAEQERDEARAEADRLREEVRAIESAWRQEVDRLRAERDQAVAVELRRIADEMAPPTDWNAPNAYIPSAVAAFRARKWWSLALIARAAELAAAGRASLVDRPCGCAANQACTACIEADPDYQAHTRHNGGDTSDCPYCWCPEDLEETTDADTRRQA